VRGLPIPPDPPCTALFVKAMLRRWRRLQHRNRIVWSVDRGAGSKCRDGALRLVRRLLIGHCLASAAGDVFQAFGLGCSIDRSLERCLDINQIRLWKRRDRVDAFPLVVRRFPREQEPFPIRPKCRDGPYFSNRWEPTFPSRQSWRESWYFLHCKNVRLPCSKLRLKSCVNSNCYHSRTCGGVQRSSALWMQRVVAAHCGT